jgi:hypothetical protein
MFAKQPDLTYLVQCVGESLDLRSIDFAIALSEIYEDVEL